MSVSQDAEGSATKSDLTRFPWTIEVALSGGGLRATAFALGALLYLSHSRLCKKVVRVISVSGGSITNGFVADNCDFSVLSGEDFRKNVAAPLAERVARQGLFRDGTVWLYIAMLFIVSLPLVASVLLPNPLWATGLAALGPISILYLRAMPISHWLNDTFLSKRSKLQTLSGIFKPKLEHVFCATSLNSGLPIFFSSQYEGLIASQRYGVCFGDILLAQVVRASASFPPLIPPCRVAVEGPWFVERDWQVFTSGQPRRLWLSDGGIFNNLGTEWPGILAELEFTLLGAIGRSKAQQRTVEEEKRSVAEKPERTIRLADIQLVIDAGQIAVEKRMATLFIPIVSVFANVLRTLLVVYEGGLSARRDPFARRASARMKLDPTYWGRDVGFTAETNQSLALRRRDVELFGPLTLFASLSALPGQTMPMSLASSVRFADEADSARAFALRNDLYVAQQKYGRFWPTLQAVPTTFSSLRDETTLRLIIHGYLKAREVMLTVFPQAPTPEIPELDYFTDLLPPKTVFDQFLDQVTFVKSAIIGGLAVTMHWLRRRLGALWGSWPPRKQQ